MSAIERRWWKSTETARMVSSQPADGADWVWVDLANPDQATLRALTKEFELDEMAVEDALDLELYPSQQDFGDFLSISLRFSVNNDGVADTTPLLAFFAKNYLITIHHSNLPGLEFLAETAQRHKPTAEGGPDRMFSRLADAGSRLFDPSLQEIDALLLESERLALDGEAASMRLLQPVRHHINELRSVIRPQRSVIQALVYSDSDLIGERANRRLTDVLERHVRVDEELEVDRAAASSVIDLYRGTIAQQTNDVMKVLTVFSAVLLPMTLIAGIYGMNFESMPELDYRYGYPLAISSMALIGLLMWRMFVRRGFVGRPIIPDLAATATSKLAAAAGHPAKTVGSIVLGGLRPRRKRSKSAQSRGGSISDDGI